MVKPPCSNFRMITANVLGVRILRIFTVGLHYRYRYLQINRFLICFPMNYRDFSVKINGENNSFYFRVFMNSRLKVLPKRFKM